tara:strand:- start:130 stop:345 length:216 start_codon:yes stop_codon:yes gene_type:complete
MSKKMSINELRQTKEYYVPKVEYKYIPKASDFKQKIINLRKSFPNDADFGAAVASLLLQPPNNNYPGVQNL